MIPIQMEMDKQPAIYADRRSEAGMTMMAVMVIMVLIAIALLAAAPSVQLEIQREKELESMRRGEEIAEAIREYFTFHRGTKLPESIDDLLEGLPQGTKKRMILRPSAATDPLSETGEWLLIQPEPQTLARFAQRVQNYNNGQLPPNPSQLFDRYSIMIVNAINTETEETNTEPDELPNDTDDVPFIGVASQSKSPSVLTYYGLENHSKWIYTPLFRGSSGNQGPMGGPRRGAPANMPNIPN